MVRFSSLQALLLFATHNGARKAGSWLGGCWVGRVRAAGADVVHEAVAVEEALI